MPKPSAASRESQGWGIRLSFLGHVVAEHGAGDAAPLTLGEHHGCDLVIPGVGERIAVTEGATLVIPTGLVGEIHVGGDTLDAAGVHGRVNLAPGDHARLRVAAHPDIVVEIRRVERERLPWSARFHARDLARQLVTGAALVGMVALLWRVERAENALKLRGDPSALEDSPLLRVMFAPTPEPLDVTRTRELYAPRQVAPSSPAPPGPDAQASAPAPIAFLQEGQVEVLPPPPEHADPPTPAVPVRSKRVRKARRADDGPQQPLSILSAANNSDVFAEFVNLDAGGAGGLLGALDDSHLSEGIGSIKHVPSDLPLEKAASGGQQSHSGVGAAATRGERDGLAAVAPSTSCADPEIVRKQQIDVVFTVDVSTTMNFMLGKIGREIAAVDAAVRAHNLDARYGLVVFVDDVLVTHGGQPFADLAALQHELAVWQAFTASNRQIQSADLNLDWPENTLDALHAAAAEFAWRPAATTLRAVVHATDDEFGEAPAIQSGQPVGHGYRQTVAALQAAEIRVFSFAARIGGQCECLDVTAGLFAPYRGQQAIPAATGGAVFDIDAVAAGTLNFGAAVSGALQAAVCTHYPLSPFAAARAP